MRISIRQAANNGQNTDKSISTTPHFFKGTRNNHEYIDLTNIVLSQIITTNSENFQQVVKSDIFLCLAVQMVFGFFWAFISSSCERWLRSLKALITAYDPTNSTFAGYHEVAKLVQKATVWYHPWHK